MAIDVDTEFPSTRRNDPDANYPHGSAKDLVTEGTGTPVVNERVFNDLWGFLQGLLYRASITPNGNPDTATGTDTQYQDALFESGIISSDAIGLPLTWGDKSAGEVELEINADPGGTNSAYFGISHGATNTSFLQMLRSATNGMIAEIYNYFDVSLKFDKTDALKIWDTSNSFFVKPDRLVTNHSVPWTVKTFNIPQPTAPNSLTVTTKTVGYRIKAAWTPTPYALTGIPYDAIIHHATVNLVNTSGQRFVIPVTLQKESVSSGDFRIDNFVGEIDLPSIGTFSSMTMSVAYQPA